MAHFKQRKIVINGNFLKINIAVILQHILSKGRERTYFR